MIYTAETSLITYMFWDDPSRGTAVDEAAGLLAAEDFAHEGARLTFRALLKLRETALPIDLQHALEQMERDGVPADRAIPLLNDATMGAPVAGELRRYIQEVKEASRLRKLARSIGIAGERIQGGEDVLWVKNELMAETEEIDSAKQSSEVVRLGDVAGPALNAMADRLSGDDSKKGLQTGIDRLDMTTTGINAGELWVCGAMPGRGKTALALQIAMNISGAGWPVYFVSLEMSRSAIFRRLLKMQFGAKTVEYPGERWSELVSYGADLKTLPFFIDDASSLEINEITARARVQIARNGARLIIVDYLQLVRSQGRDRRERVGDATDALRRLAKDTNVPVLALSQLRRPDNINDRPSMIDLKESGDIEAHAQVVLLLHAPIAEDGSPTGEEEIIIGKQREGPTGTVYVFFDRSRVKFEPRTTRAA